MSPGRSVIPDLDALESPLLSPTSLSGLGGGPGSAIAEKIFNDPDSWDDTSGDEGDYPEDIDSDTLAWFTEEIEKLRRQSAGVGMELARGDKRENDLVPKREGNAGWKDIARRGSVRPISLAGLFEQSNDDFSKEIQQHLSKILDSGGIIKHHIGPRTASSLSPPYTSSTQSTADSISTPLTSSIGEMSPAVYPASATLSFLEYYGIYPDSPLFDGRKLSRKKKSGRRPPQSKDSSVVPLRPTLPRVPSTEKVSQTPSPRLSSVPPPGLELPFQPYAPNTGARPAPPGLFQITTTGHDQASPSSDSSPRSRNNSEHEVIVPLQSGSGSSPRSRPLPTATTTGASPHASPISADAAPSPVRVRRLPSIPSEPQLQVLSTPPDQSVSRQTTPPPQSNAPTSAAFLSPTKSSTALSSFSLGSASQASMGMRSPLTIRSPLGVPLGPRTRARSSDAGRQLATAQPC